MGTILVTGFEPFGSESINASWEAVQGLVGLTIGAHQVVVAQMPVVYRTAIPTLVNYLTLYQPVAVLCIGQAAGQGSIELERVALNLADSSGYDNEGVQRIEMPIVEGGPAAYFATLPLRAIHTKLQQAGIPVKISPWAGGFLCNYVFYGLMHHLRGTAIPAGFIHIPVLPSQSVSPESLELEQTVKALNLILESLTLPNQ